MLDDDDLVERERILSEGSYFRRLCLRASRRTSTELLTVHLGLDPVNDDQRQGAVRDRLDVMTTPTNLFFRIVGVSTDVSTCLAAESSAGGSPRCLCCC